MSLSKELFVGNSLNTCDTAGSSIHNDEGDPVCEDSLLDQLAEFTLTNMMLDPSASNAVESKLENNILVENESNLTDAGTPGKQVTRNGIQRKVWTCDVCAKEFTQHYKLARHLYIHGDKRNYKCTICGKAFRQMSTLCQHRAIHSTAKPHSCPVCKKSFNRGSTLISHRKTHDGVKPHQCPQCPRAFHQKANLTHHIFTHTNERPYKCEICPKAFNQLSNLACHKLKIHRHNSVPHHVCRLCGRSFVKRADCRQHELQQHANTSAGITPSGERDPNPTPNTVKILIDPIDTAAMRLARELHQPLLVLLKPLDSVPVVVRVHDAGDKQMLVPVTWTDLCRYSQITKEQTDPNGTEQQCKLQIKIPIVATMQEVQTGDGLPNPAPNPTVIVTNCESGSRILKEDFTPANV